MTPRFTAVPNVRVASRKEWPWLVVDGTTDEACAYASNENTARVTAKALNDQIDLMRALGPVEKRPQ